MPDTNLGDDTLKLVKYSIVCIERDREKVLVCNECELFGDNMTDCDFATWVIARYVDEHRDAPLPCNKKDLRVVYEVLGRWPKQDLRYEEKQLRRLAEIRDTILMTEKAKAAAEREARAAGADLAEVEEVVEVEKVEKVEEVEEVEEAEPDDLTKIEGVGPKIAELLAQAGIPTFSRLARTTIRRLQGILDAAGPRYRLADPTTWRDQARLAAAGDWPALAQLQEELKGGRVAKKKTAREAAPKAPQLDQGETQVLAALDALGGQAAMRELVRKTGLSSSTLSRRLKALIDAGLVRRIGDGLKTRYQRVAK